jgi:DNA polymerase delta subunit 2
MYFLRLTMIKPAVEEIASAAFGEVIIGGEPPKKLERVLDVRQGELCWVAGTVYMDMPLKPNILEDVSKDASLLTTPSQQALTAGSDGSRLLRQHNGIFQTITRTRSC